jgi:hypothetical protein
MVTSKLTKIDFREYENCTICVDWFEVFCKSEVIIKNEQTYYKNLLPPIVSGELYQVGDVYLKYVGYGTAMYLYLFDVIIEGEKVATLQAYPRGEVIAKDCLSFKLNNSILYADYWVNIVIEITEKLQLTVNNVTRLDIAIDGLNYLILFLNMYAKQPLNDKKVHLKGKAKFDCKNQNHNSMNFESFTLGTLKSDKQISLYLKSKELEVSNKKYIETFWRENGMTKDIVYRLELRLQSKSIREIENFDYKRLNEPYYLASIFKTQTNNYFHFITHTGQKNKTREHTIEVINFENLGGELLPKLKRGKTEDRYKAKLLIHLTQKLLLRGEIPKEKEKHNKKIIKENIARYQLEDWYSVKIEDWKRDYTQMQINV